MTTKTNGRAQVARLRQVHIRNYEARQVTSAEVVKELVELARELRSQARRHEQLGLSREETAFYDALAAKGEDFVDDPRLKEIAVDLVAQVRQDLAVDRTQRGNLDSMPDRTEGRIALD